MEENTKNFDIKGVLINTLLIVILGVSGFFIYKELSKGDNNSIQIKNPSENNTQNFEEISKAKTVVLENNMIFVQKDGVKKEVEIISELAQGDPITKILVSPSGEWVAYGVLRDHILNVGGEVIGDIYEWQVYNVEYTEVIFINEKLFETKEGQIIKPNKAEKWVENDELIVVEDDGMVLNGVLIFNPKMDSLRELSEEEMVEYGYEGMF